MVLIRGTESCWLVELFPFSVSMVNQLVHSVLLASHFSPPLSRSRLLQPSYSSSLSILTFISACPFLYSSAHPQSFFSVCRQLPSFILFSFFYISVMSFFSSFLWLVVVYIHTFFPLSIINTFFFPVEFQTSSQSSLPFVVVLTTSLYFSLSVFYSDLCYYKVLLNFVSSHSPLTHLC